MGLTQKIKKVCLGIVSILAIVFTLSLITRAESLSYEDFRILVVGVGVFMISAIIYQAYINLRQIWIKPVSDEEDFIEFNTIEEEVDEEKYKDSLLENKIAFFTIKAIANLFSMKAEWNKETNQIIVRNNEIRREGETNESNNPVRS